MPFLPYLLIAAFALDRNLAVLSEERIGAPSTAYNHSSTLAEAADGSLVAAWYGGSAEGADDVSIWASRKEGSSWSPIVEVADGRRDDGRLYACWTPPAAASSISSTRSVPDAPRRPWPAMRTGGAASRLRRTMGAHGRKGGGFPPMTLPSSVISER